MCVWGGGVGVGLGGITEVYGTYVILIIMY